MRSEALRKFLSRIKTATQTKTDVRMPLNEANELAADIAELLIEVIEKRERQAPAPEIVQISLDGGNMKK